MQPLPFRKMHGLGNDFVVLDGRRSAVAPDARAAAARSPTGTGASAATSSSSSSAADGADARMRFCNADGSERGACGNATRCVARLLLDGAAGRVGAAARDQGRRAARRGAAGGRSRVDMAPPRSRWDEIPLAQACDTALVPLEFDGLGRPTARQHGQPARRLLRRRPAARSTCARARAGDRARTRCSRSAPISASPRCSAPSASGCACWERGAGLTLACGTGACAAMVAARRRGLTGDAAVRRPGRRRAADRLARRGPGRDDRAGRARLRGRAVDRAAGRLSTGGWTRSRSSPSAAGSTPTRPR